VIVNFTNVGTTFATQFYPQTAADGLAPSFHWEGVRLCVKFLRGKRGLDVIGVVFQNQIGCDGQPDGLQEIVGIPGDICENCLCVQEAPRSCSSRQRHADVEMTIKLAFRRHCRFLDNDNYRDWAKHHPDAKIRHWLKQNRKDLQMNYYFDQMLRCFETLDGIVASRDASPSVASRASSADSSRSCREERQHIQGTVKSHNLCLVPQGYVKEIAACYSKVRGKGGSNSFRKRSKGDDERIGTGGKGSETNTKGHDGKGWQFKNPKHGQQIAVFGTTTAEYPPATKVCLHGQRLLVILCTDSKDSIFQNASVLLRTMFGHEEQVLEEDDIKLDDSIYKQLNPDTGVVDDMSMRASIATLHAIGIGSNIIKRRRASRLALATARACAMSDKELQMLDVDSQFMAIVQRAKAM